MALEKDLVEALTGTTRPVSLRELKKARLDRVQVIERSRFLEVMAGVEASGQAKGKVADERRVERLLRETEKLGREKKDLEHAKGLVEAERGRLQALIDAIVVELGRKKGEKVEAEDVKKLLDELGHLRRENRKLGKTLDRLQKHAQARLDKELTKNQSLSENLKRIQQERERVQGERDQLEDEQEAFRQELEQFRGERDRFREERDQFREERDRFREERDDSLKSCASLSEEREALRQRVKELEQARQALKELEQMRDRERQQAGDLEREVERLRLELEVAGEEVDSARDELEEAKKNDRVGRGLSAAERRLRRETKQVGFGFGFPTTKKRGY